MNIDKKAIVKSFAKDYLKVLNGDLSEVSDTYPLYVFSELFTYLNNLEETETNKLCKNIILNNWEKFTRVILKN